MRLREHEVAIVGAGPTGLMLAGELALAGVDVAVIERRVTQEVPGRRAGGLHARSLELLDQRGIVDRFLAEGQRCHSVSFFGALDISDFPTRHNYLLALRQQRIEQLLADWADELGVQVYRGHEMLDLRVSEKHVALTTDVKTGFRAGWVVGSDGGRSAVRKAAALPFPGWEASTSWLIAEVKVRQLPPLGFHEDAAGRHAIAMLDDGETIGVVIAGRNPFAAGTPSLDELASALRSIYGTDFGVHAPTWMSRFNDATRQAETYRDGRVLIAGDAAHIHSPLGGQGLNLGMQDAVNLGWKLAQVVKGTAPDTLLDTYQAERQPATARILRSTIAHGVLRSPGDRVAILGEFVSETLQMDAPRRHFAAMMAGLDLRYGADAGHPLQGRRIPDLNLVTADGPTPLFAFLRDARPLLLNLGGAKTFVSANDNVKVVEATANGVLELPLIGAVTLPTAVLVRPDGYVAWVAGDNENEPCRAIKRWFGSA